jgi:hypothetical protein
MGFKCELRLNNGAINPEDEVVFISWIKQAWGKYYSVNVKYAKVLLNNEEAFLGTNCPCFLSERGKFKKGDKIKQDTIIGYFEADGEVIPYNRPYSTIEIIK